MCEVPAIASHGFCVFIDGNSKERQEIWMVVTTVSAILGVFFVCFFTWCYLLCISVILFLLL